MRAGVQGIDESVLTELGGQGIELDVGIVELTSDFEYDDTIQRLKAAVTTQSE